MKRIIINADDCGRTQYVDAHIEEAIKLEKISSTTIMANQDDFEGAVRLYNDYHKTVSFGWHINLDEGVPLTRSQLLLDKGFYLEKDGKVTFNGMAFRTKFLSKEMRDEIKNELRAQWEKLKDNGIEISHADSHHFIHTQPSMAMLMPSIFKEMHISRCRHISNYGSTGISKIARKAWAYYFGIYGFRMPDTFCSFIDYYNNRFLGQGDTIELMCHPGHESLLYQKEFELVKAVNLNDWGATMVTYNQI